MPPPADEASRPPGLVLVGKPGSGKGTQGRALAVLPGFVHLATGVMLRNIAEGPDARAREVRELLGRGELIPDELLLELFGDHLAALRDGGQYRPESDVLVLDGIPRTVSQAERLTDQVDVRLVIHLRADDEEALLERVLGRALIENRSDDRAEAARERFVTFAREPLPVLDFYPPAVRAEIEALQHPLLVHDAIVRAVVDRFL